MAFKLNIFTGTFDIVEGFGFTSWKSPVANAASLPIAGNTDGDARVTLDTSEVWVWDNATSRWESQQFNVASAIGATPNAIGYSISTDISTANLRYNTLVLQPADATNPGVVSTLAQEFAGNKTFNNDVIVQGDFTVNGTSTTINTTNLDVEDKNVTINKNGNDVSAEDAGLTVERAGVDGSLVYEDALASKWKAGSVGLEIELANVSSTQSLTNKNLKSDTNLLTGASSDNFKRETGNQETVNIPDTTISDNIVLEQFTQTLQNKTIDATAATGNNTITMDALDNTYDNSTSGLTAIDVQAAIDELDSVLDNNQLEDNQDRNIKLVEGGEWSLSSTSSSVLAQNLTGGSITETNLTTRRRAQSFTTIGATQLESVEFDLRYFAGTVSGNLFIELFADNGASPGIPTGPVLATSNNLDTSTLTTSFETYTFIFASNPLLSASTKYHAVINFSNITFGSGRIQNNGVTSNPYAGGNASASSDSGVTWSSESNNDAVFTINILTSADNLTLSSDAYIEVGGLERQRNTILAQTINLPNANSVAHVDINRSGTGATNLTVNVSNVNSLVLTDDTVVIARKVSDGVLIGKSFLLQSGESTKLDEIHNTATKIKYDDSVNALYSIGNNVQDALDGIKTQLDAQNEADEITYDNTTSGLTATDVQAALDEIDAAVDNKAETDLSNITSAGQEVIQDVVSGILTDTASVDFTYDDAGNQIRADVLPAGVDHDALNNFVANEHVDHTTVEIATAADSGLSGGGDITATRNLSVNINGTTAETSVAQSDEVLIYDASATALRKATVSNLLGNSSPSAGDLSEASFALANNQAVASNITGLSFANATSRSAKIHYSIEIDATSDLYEVGELHAIQRGADWVISREFNGDDTGIGIDVNSSGQFTYTSPNFAGYVSAQIKFRAITTSV